MSEVNPKKPGVDPQPWTGIQYVSIPEFQDVGNQVSQEIVDAIAGRQTVDQALEQGQRDRPTGRRATRRRRAEMATHDTETDGTTVKAPGAGPEAGHWSS